MHKLRLRSRSIAGESSSSPSREVVKESQEGGGKGNSNGNGNGSKGREKPRVMQQAAVGAGNGSGQPTLGGDGNDFRTSLILVGDDSERSTARANNRLSGMNIQPYLTRRFTLLRADDGSLVSLDQMQAHLRCARVEDFLRNLLNISQSTTKDWASYGVRRIDHLAAISRTVSVRDGLFKIERAFLEQRRSPLI